MPRDGLLSPRDPQRVPGQPRCPQNQPHNVRQPDCPYALQMSQGIPRQLEMTPMLPDSPVPMPSSCPQTVSAPQISRRFHRPQMSTQTLGISHSPVHLRHFRRPPHVSDVHRWSPGFPDFTEGPKHPGSPDGPHTHPTSKGRPHVSQKSTNSQAP